MPAEKELVRTVAGQVGQEIKPNTVRFTNARRVKEKTHQDPFLAQKKNFGCAHAQGGVSLQKEVQSHRPKGMGDSVTWRREQSDD